MKSNKNLCPVGFLWRGSGVGRTAMIIGLLAIFAIVLVKIAALVFWHEPLALREFFIASSLLWLVGKGLCVMQPLLHGAQKRTRTSTKSNFTRT